MNLLTDNKKVRLISSNEQYAIYEYTPTIFKPLLVNLEKMSVTRRVRFLLEYLGKRHYKVYYLVVDGEAVGQLVIAPGGRRLKCSTERDIVIGPSYVPPIHRGKGYAKILTRASLNYPAYPFEYSYAYISKSNIPSIKATVACGYEPCGELNIVGRTRKLVETENGSHVIYRIKSKEITNG